MKEKLRLLCLLLLAALALSVSAFAEEDEGHEEGWVYDPGPGQELFLSTSYSQKFSAGASKTEIDALTRLIREGLWAGEVTISFNGSTYPTLTLSDVGAILTNLYGTKTPDMFAVKSLGGRYSSGGPKDWGEYELKPAYNLDANEYAAAKSFYTSEIEKIVDKVDPSWPDTEKVLFVNDYLALNYKYDPRYGGIDSSQYNYDAYSFFRDHYGVCNAYTMAVRAVLEKLNIPCSWCESGSLNHIWNIVQIGGQWYHMDVTWNDPTPDYEGYAGHTYFLLSTSALRTVNEGRHYHNDDWVYGESVTCDSTGFDKYFWKDAISAFAFTQGCTYFVSASGLMSWDGVSDSAVELVNFSQLYKELYPSYYGWSGYAWRAGVFYLAGKLYYNTSFNVLSYDLQSKKTEGLFDGITNRGDNITMCRLRADNELEYTRGNKTYTIQFQVYTTVDGAGYSYYFDSAALHLKLESDTIVVIAYYSGEQMTACEVFSTAGDYTAQASGDVKLFALNTSWIPKTATVITNYRVNDHG